MNAFLAQSEIIWRMNFGAKANQKYFVHELSACTKRNYLMHEASASANLKLLGA